MNLLNYIPWWFCLSGTDLDKDFIVKSQEHHDVLNCHQLCLFIILNTVLIKHTQMKIGRDTGKICLFPFGEFLSSWWFLKTKFVEKLRESLLWDQSFVEILLHNVLTESKQRAHFINDFSIVIQICWKFGFDRLHCKQSYRDKMMLMPR